MHQAYVSSVLGVSSHVCCKCFICMLHMFAMAIHMFSSFFLVFVSVLDICCKCFSYFERMLQLFHATARVPPSGRRRSCVQSGNAGSCMSADMIPFDGLVSDRPGASSSQSKNGSIAYVHLNGSYLRYIPVQ
jgi:hypothetical protein